MKVTRLEDARFFKSRGQPLNTPVEERILAREYETHWEKLMGAYDEFMRAVYRYSNEPKWRAVKQKLELLRKEVERCDAFLLGTLNEEDSALLLAFFLQQRAHPFIDYWQGAIDTIESGRDLTINSTDIPIWFDPEP
jgi:hypothetical protein